MKLLVITERVNATEANGSEVFSDALITELRRHHSVFTLARQQGSSPRGPGRQSTLFIDEATLRDARTLRTTLKESLKDREFDLIYNYGGLRFGSRMLAVLRLVIKDIPIVNHFQALLAEYSLREGLDLREVQQARASQSDVMKRAALNIFPSSSELRLAMQHGYPLERGITAVIPNGIVPSQFAKVRPDYAIYGDRHADKETRPFTIFTAGRFGDFIKGGDIVYRAFALLQRQFPEAFLFAATNSKRFTEILQPLPPESYKIADWMERNDFLRAMKAADLVVVPSRYESCGMVAIEAMMLGKVVVANAVGGLEDIVAHNRTGILVEPGAGSFGLYEAIAPLIENKDELRRLGRKAKKKVAQSFTIDIVAERIEEELERALLHHESSIAYTGIDLTH